VVGAAGSTVNWGHQLTGGSSIGLMLGGGDDLLDGLGQAVAGKPLTLGRIGTMALGLRGSLPGGDSKSQIHDASGLYPIKQDLNPTSYTWAR